MRLACPSHGIAVNQTLVSAPAWYKASADAGTVCGGTAKEGLHSTMEGATVLRPWIWLQQHRFVVRIRPTRLHLSLTGDEEQHQNIVLHVEMRRRYDWPKLMAAKTGPHHRPAGACRPLVSGP